MPEWRRLALNWKELAILLEKWKTILSQWRGIYFILDEEDGKGYVGAADGKENMLHRWLEYSKSGHGGNKLLRSRKPDKFNFRVLELVAQSTENDQVQAIEASWKDRLHTRTCGLNEN